jgi:hypothetical protein
VIARIDAVHKVITDSAVALEIVSAVRAKNVDVLVV